MILGMSTATFTLVHVILSLIGIAAGVLVMLAMLVPGRISAWTALFLVTTVATSATGFLFHSVKIGPPHIVGVISLVVLAIAIYALFFKRLAGAWRWIYVATAVLAQYLNCFVGVVQAFQKLSFLQPLAPTQTEPPFLAAQGALLVLFIVLGVAAAKRFHPERPTPA